MQVRLSDVFSRDGDPANHPLGRVVQGRPALSRVLEASDDHRLPKTLARRRSNRWAADLPPLIAISEEMLEDVGSKEPSFTKRIDASTVLRMDRNGGQPDDEPGVCPPPGTRRRPALNQLSKIAI